MNITKTLAALSLTTSLLASACALEEGDELEAEIGESEHALVDYDENLSGDGRLELAVTGTGGAAAVIEGSTGTLYAVGDTLVNGQRRMALRMFDRYGAYKLYESRDLAPTGYAHAWANAAVNMGGPLTDTIFAVGGAADAGYDSRRVQIARITSGGLDTSFSGDGFRVHDLTGYDHEEALAVAGTADGKLVVGGNACQYDPNYGDACRAWVARFDATTGERDSTFGVSGLFILARAPFPNRSDELQGLAVDAYGGVIVVTEERQSTTYAGNVVVRRVTPQGTLDTTFAAGEGRRWFHASTAGGVAIDPVTRRIVVVGGDYNESGLVVWQMTYAGILVPGFGGSKNIANGWAYIDYASRAEERWEDVKIDRHGRILLLGSGWDPSAASFTLVRLLQNGEPDTTFDHDDGKEFITFPSSPDSFGLSLHIGYDHAFAAGLGVDGATEKFAIARFANP